MAKEILLGVETPLGNERKCCKLSFGSFIFIHVIKLKSLITEGRERSNCWISPSGRVIPVTDTHDTTARKIFSHLGQPMPKDAVGELFKKGFLRVTYMYDGSLVAHNTKHRPNDKQVAVLKDLAIEGEHSKVEYDNERDKNQILWSEFDTLQESGVKIDQVDGIGATSHNQNIRYFGFEKEMTPDEFLSLTPPMYEKPTPLKSYADLIQTRGMASPFFSAEWLPDKKAWQIMQHEGRHRMTAVKQFFGKNTKVPVHIFPLKGLRARDLTPEMINAPLLPQKK